MMGKIYFLIDYKKKFGSKWDSFPYRSGMKISKLMQYFVDQGFTCKCINFSDLPPATELSDGIVLYTSSEDIGGYYKTFIEDVVFSLERQQIKVVPDFDFLLAHNNKVYMELLRNRRGQLWGDILQSRVFGCLEDLEEIIDKIQFPVVLKKSEGALSRGVFLARSKKELFKLIKKISRVRFIKDDLKDKLRPFKHKGYIKESVNRKKFILQPFIPNLKNDWKILIYGDRLFVLTRHVREKDFRASGSHCNYLAGSKALLPDGILDYAVKVQKGLDVPHLSLDVVFDGKEYHVVEFQALYFGTSTVNMSDVFFKKERDVWGQFENNLSIEQLYADGLLWYLKQ